MENFGDRVVGAVRAKRSPAVVGLDPRTEWLPEAIRIRHGLGPGASPRNWALAVEEFCCRVLDIVAPWVPAVKLQSAFFELHGATGIEVLGVVLRKAHRLGLITILDAKRGDIGSTSEGYAEAAFGKGATARSPLTSRWGGLRADSLTVSPYLGRDSLEPFLEFTRTGRFGLFTLVRTSNAGSRDLQQLGTAAGGRPVFAHVAQWVQEWAEATRGRGGYGSVAAVVGGTAGDQIAELRKVMPSALLLIPGYGAQGAGASDIAAAFDANGFGALVNSSRAILFPDDIAPESARPITAAAWEGAVAQAVERMVADLAEHTTAGRLRASQ